MVVAALLGLVHATVDAATVTAVYRAGGFSPAISVAFAWIVAYDLVAFGLQPALGRLQDRRFSPRAGMAAGLGCTTLGLALAAAVPGSLAATAAVVASAALGNALFHLGAGAAVLGLGLERATPVGLLVAPGAAGLALGVWFGGSPATGPTWWAFLPLLAGALVTVGALRLSLRGPSDAGTAAGRAATPIRRPPDRPRWGERLTPAPDVARAVIGLLLLSVAIRALVGGAAARGYDRTQWLVVGLPVAAVAGKALGGVIADRAGWTRTTVAALVVAAPVVAFVQPHPAVLLLGLMVFQLTMPVTLVAVARMIPERLATGFGLTCLALILGALPTMFGWGAALVARPALGAWVLLSAGVAWAGLTGGGLRWRRTPPELGLERVAADGVDAVGEPRDAARAGRRSGAGADVVG